MSYKQYQNIVVGAGISGVTAARLIAEQLDETVLVIDKKDHIAGNIYDYKDSNGITIHKYGSHIFHTNDDKAWSFVRRFTDFNQYMHSVIAVIDGVKTHIPFNFRTIYDVFPQSLAQRIEAKLLELYSYNSKIPILNFLENKDEDLLFLAKYIYDKVYVEYTSKQWGVNPEQLDGLVTARVPVYLSCDPRYFQDKYQGIPLNGYTDMVKRMLDHSNITVALNQEFDASILKSSECPRVLYTGSLDELFDYQFGVLPYRSVHFSLEEHDCPYYQEGAVVNYPCNYDFTRIHEYKYYLNEKSEKTVIAKEYSEAFQQGKNDRYYPIPNHDNNEMYSKYASLAKQNPKLVVLGRLGDYRYYDMDKAIIQAIACVEKICSCKN